MDGDKIVINKDEILRDMEIGFKNVCGMLENSENPDCSENTIKDFYDTIDRSIVSFFYGDNAGFGIKKMYGNKSGSVKAMDFAFAFNQYQEYLKGMKTYIDEFKMAELSNPEIIEKINDVILKDDDFIKSIFCFGENKNNAEAVVSIELALQCLNTLFSIRDIVNEFKQEIRQVTILDKLANLSRVKMLYYAVSGIFNQVARIADELNGVKPAVEKPVFAVF